MKRFLFILSVFLLLFIACFKTSAQESTDKVIRKVTIVNNEGKPQQDILNILIYNSNDKNLMD